MANLKQQIMQKPCLSIFEIQSLEWFALDVPSEYKEHFLTNVNREAHEGQLPEEYSMRHVRNAGSARPAEERWQNSSLSLSLSFQSLVGEGPCVSFQLLSATEASCAIISTREKPDKQEGSGKERERTRHGMLN